MNGRTTTRLPIATQVYTIGFVARACGVAIRTAAKWIDSGKLKGYRVPGSLDRRVYPEDLIRFLRENKMRVPEWLASPVPVVGCLVSPAWLGGGVEVVSPLRLGTMAAREVVTAVVIGTENGLSESLAVARELAGLEVNMGLIVGDDVSLDRVPDGVFGFTGRISDGPNGVLAWAGTKVRFVGDG